MGESVESDSFFDEFFQFYYIGIGRFSWELAPGRASELHGVEWGSGISSGRGPGFCTRRSGRWSLPSGQGIVLVVENEIGDGVISSAGMEEVSEPDSVPVPVSSDADHMGFGVRELDPDGERYRPSMQGFCCIPIDVLGDLPRAPDSAHDNNILLRDFELL